MLTMPKNKMISLDHKSVPLEICDMKFILENELPMLSEYGRSVMLNKITEVFSDDEQQLFIKSFVLYIKHKKTDKVISLEDVWEWIGFARKLNGKTLLVNENTGLIEGPDYSINLATTAAVASFENMHGGQNKEIIMMTTRAFKILCMKANTKRSNQILIYFTKLEDIIFETVYEQGIESSSKLLESSKTILSLQNKLQETSTRHEEIVERYVDIEEALKDSEHIIAQLKDMITDSAEIQLVNSFRDMKLLYIAIAEDGLAKPGSSKEIQIRLNSHKNIIGSQFTLKYVIATPMYIELEALLKETLKHINVHKEYVHTTSTGVKTTYNYTELYKLDSKFTIRKLYELALSLKKQIEIPLVIEQRDATINELKLQLGTSEELVKNNMKLSFENAQLKAENEQLKAESDGSILIDLQYNSMENLNIKRIEMQKAVCYNFLVDYIVKQIKIHDNETDFILKLTINEIHTEFKKFSESNNYRDPLEERYEKSIISKSFNIISGITDTTFTNELRGKIIHVKTVINWICKNINVPKRFRNIFRDISQSLDNSEKCIVNNINDECIKCNYEFFIEFLISKICIPDITSRGNLILRKNCNDIINIMVRHTIINEEYLKYLLVNGIKRQKMESLYKTIGEIHGISHKRVNETGTGFGPIRAMNIDVPKAVKWLSENLEISEKFTNLLYNYSKSEDIKNNDASL